MKRRIFNYSVVLIIMVFITFSCKDEFFVSQYPPSPINIPNAITFNPNLKYDTVTDIDGNIYKTITIGKHTWMAENLRVTRFRNGDKIPHLPSKKDWANDDIWGGDGNLGLCAYDNNNNRDSIAKYGLLYGVLAIKDTRCIAPLGWHIATHSDWSEILGVSKDSTLTYRGAEWVSSIVTENTTINYSGLTLLPSGSRNSLGKFVCRGISVVFYVQSSSFISFYINYIFQSIEGGQLWRYGGGGYGGYSIRCVKDE